MKLNELKVGDQIDYKNHVGRKGYKSRTGTIIQITPKHITVQGAKYPDTILIRNITTGETAITAVNGELVKQPQVNEDEVLEKAVELAGTGLSIPEIAEKLSIQSGWLGKRLETTLRSRAYKVNEELHKQNRLDKAKQQGEGEDTMTVARKNKAEIMAKVKNLREQGMSMTKIAKVVDVPEGTLWSWAHKEKQQTPNPEPEKVGRQDPAQGKEEPAGTSVAEDVNEVKSDNYLKCDDCGELIEMEKSCLADPRNQQVNRPKVLCPECFLKYKLIPGFTEKDDNPIPYTPVDMKPAFINLDKFKVRWIRDVMYEEDLEPSVQLQIVGAIQGLQIPEVG
ncbi:MAG: hypothetical protein ABFD04_11575 [Syntrophomonas sp.]